MEMRLRLHMFGCWSVPNETAAESLRCWSENKLWCTLVMMTGCSQGDRMNMEVT